MRQQKVKELRNERGWSQSDLSSLSGLSVKTIQRIERRQGTPSLDSAKALAAVFERDFADFLPSTELSTDTRNDNAVAAEIASPPQHVDLHTNFRPTARSYWQPAVITVFMAATIGFFTKLYLNVENLSADVSELLVMRKIELASVPAPAQGLVSTASNKPGNRGGFTDYYGPQPLQHAFQASGMASNEIRVSLLEISMLLDTAEIVATWEDTAATNSDLSSHMVLRDYLRCYGESRNSSDSASQNIAKLHECIYVELVDANWEVVPAMDLALKKLVQTMEESRNINLAQN